MLDKSNPDICMGSGVCYSQTDDYEGSMYINGCTDKTGKAKDCAQLCNPPSHKGANSLDVLECARGCPHHNWLGKTHGGRQDGDGIIGGDGSSDIINNYADCNTEFEFVVDRGRMPKEQWSCDRRGESWED
ncbi:hypothetical protein LMH87_011663 [Akanthomyces muscarius]|uniref:Uncharacterized protein n=1 Tax=Akanthomyces muscarius TaxID=2231603 RepID=A0A9W8UL79_AKAMU|nr:hypothetical protein LMH87_011663 [Akanthomyces muscarius]KAJ4150936.1 hypothetical protein LMH87_011663 [Akanthomyces muscarius]